MGQMKKVSKVWNVLVLAGLGFGISAWGFSKSKQTSKEPAEWVWVAKSDGALQCEQNSGIALEVGLAELNHGGVKVAESQKGSDGNMHAQMCGLSGGSLNTYKIEKKYLTKAKALGFSEIPSEGPNEAH